MKINILMLHECHKGFELYIADTNVKSEIKILKEKHIQSLYNRHTSETFCPSCGSDFLKRTVKQSARQGSQFLG